MTLTETLCRTLETERHFHHPQRRAATPANLHKTAPQQRFMPILPIHHPPAAAREAEVSLLRGKAVLHERDELVGKPRVVR